MPRTIETEAKATNSESEKITSENKQAEIKSELKQRVTSAVEAYRKTPREFAEFLKFAARFNNYSGHNLRLIWAQRRTAQFVAAASYFKAGMPDANGQPLTQEKIFINKGEKALRIWKPYEETIVHIPNDKGKG